MLRKLLLGQRLQARLDGPHSAVTDNIHNPLSLTKIDVYDTYAVRLLSPLPLRGGSRGGLVLIPFGQPTLLCELSQRDVGKQRLEDGFAQRPI